jgi:hypothetical protein
MPTIHRWRRCLLTPALATALALSACQTMPDVSGWSRAAQALSGAVVGGFEVAAALHQDIGQRLDALPNFRPEAQRYLLAAAALARRGDDHGRLFGAMADYSTSLAAVSRASAGSAQTVDAVAGSLNQLLGAVGAAGLAGAGFELGKALAGEAIKIQAARDFAEAVERADPVVARVADLLADDLADLARTLGEAKVEAIRIAYERPEVDRLDYRRGLAARLAALQAEVLAQVQPDALPNAPRRTGPLPDKGAADELARVERLLLASNDWYKPLQAAIAKAQKTRADSAVMVAQAGKAVLAWKASHASLAAAVRDKRLPDTAHLVATVTRLRELVAAVKKEN